MSAEAKRKRRVKLKMVDMLVLQMVNSSTVKLGSGGRPSQRP
jgi:hypothetical protein